MNFLWALSEMRTPFLEKLFSFITVLGEELVVIALLCAIFWCVDKELTYRIGFVYFIAGLAVQGLKITFRIDRPWILDPSFQPVGNALGTATGYSFPSGHTQSAASLYGTLAAQSRKGWQRAVLILLALLVGFSRMFLGVHTPKDVLVSLLLSALIILLVEWCFSKFSGSRRADVLASVFFLIAAALLIAYSVSLFSSGIVDREYAVDCCKAAGAGIGFAAGYYLERRYINFDPRAARLPVQLLKYIAGLAGALAIKSGLKLILGESLAADTMRYALVVLWIIALYPLLIKKYMSGAKGKPGNENT